MKPHAQISEMSASTYGRNEFCFAVEISLLALPVCAPNVSPEYRKGEREQMLACRRKFGSDASDYCSRWDHVGCIEDSEFTTVFFPSIHTAAEPGYVEHSAVSGNRSPCRGAGRSSLS